MLLAKETHAIEHGVRAVRGFSEAFAQPRVLGLERRDALLGGRVPGGRRTQVLETSLGGVRALAEGGEFLTEIAYEELELAEGSRRW
jgi:hypothetical protein